MDPSLEELQWMAQEQETQFTPDKKEQVVWDKGLLYWLWMPRNHVVSWEPYCQLIMPHEFRWQLLAIAHDLPCASHLDMGQTHQQLLANFYCPTSPAHEGLLQIF